MCSPKTPKQRANGTPNAGTPSAQDVVLANSNGPRVSRSGLINGLGFKRKSGAQLPEAPSTGEGLAARAGFGS